MSFYFILKREFVRSLPHSGGGTRPVRNRLQESLSMSPHWLLQGKDFLPIYLMPHWRVTSTRLLANIANIYLPLLVPTSRLSPVWNHALLQEYLYLSLHFIPHKLQDLPYPKPWHAMELTLVWQ